MSFMIYSFSELFLGRCYRLTFWPCRYRDGRGLIAAAKPRHSFKVGIAQQPLLFHLAGLPFRRPERLPEFLERGGSAQRGADL
jgi:hypothetical protein